MALNFIDDDMEYNQPMEDLKEASYYFTLKSMAEIIDEYGVDVVFKDLFIEITKHNMEKSDVYSDSQA